MGKRIRALLAAPKLRAGDQRLGARDGKTYWVAPEPILTDKMVARAWLDTDRQVGASAVGLKLTEEGRRRFEGYTQDHPGQRAAVIFDGRIIETPTIITPIRNGELKLVGAPAFSAEEARDIAQSLNVYRAGAEPT